MTTVDWVRQQLYSMEAIYTSVDFPEAGNEFAESVIQKTLSILGTVERTGEVTQSQETAIRNMMTGLEKWGPRD